MEHEDKYIIGLLHCRVNSLESEIYRMQCLIDTLTDRLSEMEKKIGEMKWQIESKSR